MDNVDGSVSAISDCRTSEVKPIQQSINTLKNRSTRVPALKTLVV